MRRSSPACNWIGVVLPVGKMTASRCAASRVARELGDGDIRLTVWQNLIISGMPRTSRGGAGRDRSARPVDQARARSAPGWSPAPAMSAASSPRPTPSGMPRTSRAGARPRRARHDRSTSISPAAIIPARSTTSATSDCSPARCAIAEDGDTVEGYHIIVGGGFGPDAAHARAKSIATSRPRTRRARSSACSRPISRTAPRRDESFLAFTRRHEVDALKALFEREAVAMTHRRSRRSLAHPETAPFSAEQRAWLNGFFAGLISLEAAASAASRSRRASLLPGDRHAASRADGDDGGRPGTTRPCRSPSA